MKLVEQLIARRPDIRLLTAVNGTLGIEVARTTRPTVILMDINLPGISGVEALKVLRVDPATAHIPSLPSAPTPCPATSRRAWTRVLPLSHQTHQDQRIHGYAEHGTGICGTGTW